MKLFKVVWVTTRFAAFHWWEHAPDIVSFLRSPHRHCFHVKLGVQVKGDDREVEFFTLQQVLGNYIEAQFAGRSFPYSCEELARFVLKKFDQKYKVVFCTVSEDGENGATVFNDEVTSPVKEAVQGGSCQSDFDNTHV